MLGLINGLKRPRYLEYDIFHKLKSSWKTFYYKSYLPDFCEKLLSVITLLWIVSTIIDILIREETKIEVDNVK